MSGHDPSHEELISAYLDSELSTDDARHVERVLSDNEELSCLLDELRALAVALDKLPRHSLDAPSSERIVNNVMRDVSECAAALGRSAEAAVTVPVTFHDCLSLANQDLLPSRS